MRPIKHTCPNCGHTSRIEDKKTIQFRRIALRRKTGPTGLMEYTLDLPRGVDIDPGQLLTLGQDIILCSGVGALPGLFVGLGLATTDPARAGLYILSGVGIGAGLGLLWLQDELKLQRRRLIPWAMGLAQDALTGWEDGQRLAKDQRPTVVETVTHSGGYTRRALLGECPAADDQLALWLPTALSGGSIAITKWVGGQAPFSRSQYESLLEWLGSQRPKIAIKGRGGWAITEAGRLWLRAYATQRGIALPRGLDSGSLD